MREIPRLLNALLEESGAPWDVLPHRRDFTPQETAADAHTAERELAKTVA
jgi:hypothetical protein